MTLKSNKQAGRFMVAVGAVIKHPQNSTILLVKRSNKLDWQPGEWEIVYGRMNQFEDAETALKREIKEELNTKINIGSVLRVWHIYRGNKSSAYNELIGITFICTGQNDKIKLSSEHSEYKWVDPRKALEMVKVKGIREDIVKYLKT